MSLFSIPPVADTVARLLALAVNPKPTPAVRFREVPSRTSVVAIPTRHGEVTATIYHPLSATTQPAVYVNVHGGGFVIGHPEQDDPWCRYLAAHADVVVVNPDYVLAPHRRFPTQPEQVYDVVRWVSDDERDWNGRVVCVGGQSAGGNLSAAVARLALENGGPAIALQVLHYATLDLVTSTHDKPSPAGRAALLRPWMGEVFDTAYIPDPARRRHRLASPAWESNADNLTGIAPAVVITAELDRLRGEGRRYAHKLEAVGALADYHEVPGVDHGYNIRSQTDALTRQMYALIATHVRTATAESH
jgi:acetyl esterase